jgi:hypothetical protein
VECSLPASILGSSIPSALPSFFSSFVSQSEKQLILAERVRLATWSKPFVEQTGNVKPILGSTQPSPRHRIPRGHPSLSSALPPSTSWTCLQHPPQITEHPSSHTVARPQRSSAPAHDRGVSTRHSYTVARLQTTTPPPFPASTSPLAVCRESNGPAPNKQTTNRQEYI